MVTSKFRLSSDDLDKTVNFFAENLDFEYESHSMDMSILAGEEYHLRNDSTQLNLIIVKLINSKILVDVIGGAGGSGIFNLNWGSEKSYIKRVSKVLKKYCTENNYQIEEFQD